MLSCCPRRERHVTQDASPSCCGTIRKNAPLFARDVIACTCIGAAEGFIIGSYRANQLAAQEQSWYLLALDVESKLNSGSTYPFRPHESTFDYYLQKSETTSQQIAPAFWNPVMIAALCGAAIGAASGCYEVFIKAFCPDPQKID